MNLCNSSLWLIFEIGLSVINHQDQTSWLISKINIRDWLHISFLDIDLRDHFCIDWQTTEVDWSMQLITGSNIYDQSQRSINWSKWYISSSFSLIDHGDWFLRSITEIDIIWLVSGVSIGKTVDNLVVLFVGASVGKVVGRLMRDWVSNLVWLAVGVSWGVVVGMMVVQ